MSLNLKGAFDFILSKRYVQIKIERKGKFAALQIQATPSNYSKNRDVPDNSIKYNGEYIISYSQLVETDYDPPKRGDRILTKNDTEVHVIAEVEDMFGLGENNFLGWRIKVE